MPNDARMISSELRVMPTNVRNRAANGTFASSGEDAAFDDDSTLWVGWIPSSASADLVRKIFAAFGTIKRFTFRRALEGNMPGSPPRQFALIQ